MRSHYCGQLRETDIDSEVSLCGWVHRRRDHGDGDSDGDNEQEGNVIRGGEDPERLVLPRDNEVIRKVIDPKLPSTMEIDMHNLTHLPYRNWCPICVKSKGKDMNHCDSSDKQRVVSEYCLDYCFPGDEFGYKLTVLAGKERLTGMRFATAVPTKGASGKFATDRVLYFSQEVGDSENKIIIRSDQEPSIQCLIKDIVGERAEGRTVLEESPVKSSGSNGVVERGVQEMDNQIRAIFLGFQERLGRKVDTRERIVGFIPEYAAYLMNRLSVGRDGKVAYERIKGKKPTVMGLEFGEKVLYKPMKTVKIDKIAKNLQTA